MGSFRHNRPSLNEMEAFRSLDPSPDACGRQRLTRELAEVKKNLRNGERREKRTRAQMAETKVEKRGSDMIAQVALDENKLLHTELDELTRRNVELKREVKRLTAKFSSRTRREPQKIVTSVERALLTVFATQQTAYHVKTPDGIIQNWARNVILHLVCASDVPASKTWTAFCCVTEAMGIAVDGSWSDRSARRIVLEGALAAEQMIIEDFAEALGIHLACSNLLWCIDAFISVHS